MPRPLHLLLVWTATLTVGALVAAPSAAWGWLGHQVAGDIAERYLSSAARARTQHILGDETLAEASLWADRMRSDPAPFWQEIAGPYHYVTVPPGRHYRELGAPPEGDAVTALAQFADDLRSERSSGAQRRLALRFALHIVQDLQQPLHVGNGRDRGGNDVELAFAQETLNLHRLWDATIPESAGRTRDQWLAALERRGLLRPPRDGDEHPLHWIAESGALRDTLYPPPGRVDDSYLAAALPVAEERIALAGIRAAAWLNAVFSDRQPQR